MTARNVSVNKLLAYQSRATSTGDSRRVYCAYTAGEFGACFRGYLDVASRTRPAMICSDVSMVGCGCPLHILATKMIESPEA